MVKVRVVVTPKHCALKAYSGSGGKSPLILNLGTRWRRVVNFTLRPIFSLGKIPFLQVSMG
jgi:hypothetical protein